jgi:hypothetical protein
MHPTDEAWCQWTSRYLKCHIDEARLALAKYHDMIRAATTQETKVSYVPAIDPNNCLHSNQRKGEAGPPWCNDCGVTLNRESAP